MDIIVVGYPRSGSVWLSRLLGDVLDRPVIGAHGTLSLATEGKNRPGPGRVIQAHRGYGQRVVFLVRDPRDVLVSAAAFWGWSYKDTMTKMFKGPGPLYLPPWHKYVGGWLRKQVPIIRYEDLHHNTVLELNALLNLLGETPQRSVEEVVLRQSFATKRADVETNGDQYPFGKKAQLQHLRQGGTGEWRSALPSSIARKATEFWKSYLHLLRYEDA